MNIVKKIRNINQLKREQDKLRERQTHLEKQMRNSFRNVKKSLNPKIIAKDLAFQWMVNRMAAKGIGKLLRLFN